MFKAVRKKSYTIKIDTPIDEQGQYISGYPGEDRAYREISLLDIPPSIPADAQNVTACLKSAYIWNTTPNVSARLGENSLTIGVDTLVPGMTGKDEVEHIILTLKFADGLYSLQELSDAVYRLLTNMDVSPSILSLEADYPTQKIQFSSENKVGATGVTLYNPPGTLRKLLGFPDDDSFQLRVPLGDIVLAPRKATFNRLNKYEFHCSLASPGMFSDRKSSNLLAVVVPNRAPNAMIVYGGSESVVVDASALRGMPGPTRVNAQWFSDDLREAPTYQPWSALVEICWEEFS